MKTKQMPYMHWRNHEDDVIKSMLLKYDNRSEAFREASKVLKNRTPAACCTRANAKAFNNIRKVSKIKNTNSINNYDLTTKLITKLSSKEKTSIVMMLLNI